MRFGGNRPWTGKGHEGAQRPCAPSALARGLTLIEVCVSLMVLGIMMLGIISGYVQSHRTAEWACYSLAAQSLAMQPVEQFRSASWDIYANPPVDLTTNVPARSTNVLDIPICKSNIVYATNRVWISTISSNPAVKAIYVETTWQFLNRGVFTNTAMTYRAPDQ